MNRKFVEGLLKDKVSEEDLKGLVDKLLDEHSTSVGKIKGELETAQNDLKVANQTIDTLKKDVSDRDNQLETLKNSTDDVESLKKTIAELQNTNKTSDENHKNEMNELKKSFAIEKELSNAKARNITAVKALLDLGKVELSEDGTLKGLSEQLETLSKDEGTKFLFESNNESKQSFKGAVPGETGNEDPDKAVDFSTMSYAEIEKYYNEHPEIN